MPAAQRQSAPAGTNKLRAEDRAVHEWYRFVLSFPPHLVREYLERFEIGPGQLVLDPFCGTGTVLVEAKKLGIGSVGIEANPVAHLASQAKVDWSPHPGHLLEHARRVAASTYRKLRSQGIDDEGALRAGGLDGFKLRTLPPEQAKLLLKASISPLPLHQTLVLRDSLDRREDKQVEAHERLALASALVSSISNLQFGPEVGVGKPKDDVAVVSHWLARVATISSDLESLPPSAAPARVYCGDSRESLSWIEPRSIDAVITSPPYPNEKDYTRTTRLELVILRFIESRQDLQRIKKTLVRSNTRGVYKDDADDQWVDQHPEIQRIAAEIEARRISLGKTSGFERMYARATKLYFGGMARHLEELRRVLRPGALLAYVVGDQASYLQVMIRTGQLLADIGERLGYEVVDIDLFRTRLATATRKQLREEVVVFRWN
jgi:DNA modification methylase